MSNFIFSNVVLKNNPDLNPDYFFTLSDIKNAGCENGYLICEYDFLLTDIELIAIPWTDYSTTHIDLIKSIGYILKNEYDDNFILNNLVNKPHGRIQIKLNNDKFSFILNIINSKTEYKSIKIV